MTLASIMNFPNIIVGFLLLAYDFKGTLAKSQTNSSVKTIKTEYRVIYDCIDFYEQPAFKHPALKNHSFYPGMRPTSRPSWMVSKRRNDSKDNYEASFAGFKDGGCPLGTVPIRRMSKHDVLRANKLSKEIFNSRIHLTGSEVPPGTHRAVLQTQTTPVTPKYYGIGGRFSIWNPPTESYQYSSAQFSIRNGQDSIQFGWTVNPTLYKNKETHMFIHTTTASGSSCFNTLCPGFVITQSDLPPDARIVGYSARGKQITIYDWFVYQDEINGNWWLEVGPGEPHSPIGFWPKHIFSNLAQNGGVYIEGGGETYSPPDHPDGPPMGAGARILGAGSFKWDAYCTKFVKVNEDHKVVSFDDIESISDSNKYDIKGVDKDDEHGRFFFYGGPGK